MLPCSKSITLEEFHHNHLRDCRAVRTPSPEVLVLSVRGSCPVARYADKGPRQYPTGRARGAEPGNIERLGRGTFCLQSSDI